MKNIKNKQQGFSLLELLVVLVLLAAAIAKLNQLRGEAKISSQGNDVMGFVELVAPKILDRHPNEIATLNTAAVIALDFATQYEQETLGVKSIVLPGTTSVTFNPNGTNTATEMALNGVSNLSCVDIVKKLWPQGTTMSVNGNAVKTAASQTVSGQAATIDTECDNATNVILIPLSNFS